MKKIAAFFDIDGTIYREGLITELFKKLITHELVSDSEWVDKVQPAYLKWNKRQGWLTAQSIALGISTFNQGNLRTAAFMGLWLPKRMNRLAFASVDSMKRINQYSRFESLTNQGNNPPPKSEKWRRHQS